ncbi:MAG: acetyl-CoA carboxylase, biotin carboxyl carrier protein, partial [Flavobacteriales bacterium]
MDIKEIQELIKFVAKSGATEVNLEIDNVKISIKSPAKKGAVPETTIIQQIPVAQSPAAVMPTAA